MGLTKTRLPRTPFPRRLRRSGLLTPDDLIAFFTEHDPDHVAAADPIKLAALLVRKKLLTKYQAMQLLNGKTQGFVLGQYKILDGIRQDRVGMVFLAEDTRVEEAGGGEGAADRPGVRPDHPRGVHARRSGGPPGWTTRTSPGCSTWTCGRPPTSSSPSTSRGRRSTR